ncbi:SAM-dependent methyltransferase [Actinomadura flavalba]|uniref:SAM-dependent methyltransferase n=1 Tax=Actinomadura flavalba TaxID=1120938 RepID=UPI000379C03A|nr:SAM-dependent methyltransferase [Actinomadura flavalba]
MASSSTPETSSDETPTNPVGAIPVTPDKPNTARIYDFFLGGKDHYEIDRQAAEKIATLLPDVPEAVKANRAFLQRAVRVMAEAGITQYLDIGSGLPTARNLHEVAREVNPEARVVYVDHDPNVIAHGHALLATEEGVAMITADLRDPDTILNAPQTQTLIDFTKPVGLIMIAVLHFIPDPVDKGRSAGKPLTHLLDHYVKALPPGSHLALTHACDDALPTTKSEAAQNVYKNATATIHPRSATEITTLFTGLTLLPPTPGTAAPRPVNVSTWRPTTETQPTTAQFLGGVATKP